MYFLLLPHPFQLFRGSSPENYLPDTSFLMLSNKLSVSITLLPFSSTSITITILPTCVSSLLNICPYQFNLLSCTFLYIYSTLVVPLILTFLILSSLVAPLIHEQILISAAPNFFASVFFTVHVSAPYIIAGLTTLLYNFPLTLKYFYS